MKNDMSVRKARHVAQGAVGAHLLVRAIGGVRALTGAWLVFEPDRPSEIWTGDRAVPTRAVVRSVGARDLLIGTGLAVMPSPGWLAASIGSDISDAFFARELPAERRRTTRLLALGFAALSAASALTLRGERGAQRRPHPRRSFRRR